VKVEIFFRKMLYFFLVTSTPRLDVRGANLTTAFYKASAVKISNAGSRLERFETNIFFYFEKRSSLPDTMLVVVVN
jgi:hypothetical protein